jgi:hypothetical protein
MNGQMLAGARQTDAVENIEEGGQRLNGAERILTAAVFVPLELHAAEIGTQKLHASHRVPRIRGSHGATKLVSPLVLADGTGTEAIDLGNFACQRSSDLKRHLPLPRRSVTVSQGLATRIISGKAALQISRRTSAFKDARPVSKPYLDLTAREGPVMRSSANILARSHLSLG